MSLRAALYVSMCVCEHVCMSMCLYVCLCISTRSHLSLSLTHTHLLTPTLSCCFSLLTPAALRLHACLRYRQPVQAYKSQAWPPFPFIQRLPWTNGSYMSENNLFEQFQNVSSQKLHKTHSNTSPCMNHFVREANHASVSAVSSLGPWCKS
jgi:hypothetical protein